MGRLVAPRAESDLDDIWLYIARESGSLEIATRLVDSITDRFFLLTRFPYLGTARDEAFGHGSRSFPVGDATWMSCSATPTRTGSQDDAAVPKCIRTSQDEDRYAKTARDPLAAGSEIRAGGRGGRLLRVWVARTW